MATGDINTKFPSGLWENKKMKWIKVSKSSSGKYMKVRFFCFGGREGSSSTEANSIGRNYEITCVDNEGIPLSLKTKSVGGCIEVNKNPKIGTSKIPLQIDSACGSGSSKEIGQIPSKFSFEWLN